MNQYAASASNGSNRTEFGADDSELKGAYRGVRVLLTGGSGFIGRWVARALTIEGARLWITGRDEDRLARVSEAYAIKGTRIAIDLGKPGSFARLFKEVEPDVTFNLAGYGIVRTETDESITRRINSELVEEMALTIANARASQWKGLKFVHVGSGFEYGSISGIITEASQPNPMTVYGRAKLAGTEKLREICTRTGLPAVTARVFTAYGPGEQSSRLFPSLTRAARSMEALKLTKGEQLRDFTYVRDIASGLLRLGLVREIPGCLVNLATGTLVSVRDFTECAANLLGIDPERLLFGAIPYREDEIRQDRVEVDLVRRSIGWVPSCPISEGIRETVEFEKSAQS